MSIDKIIKFEQDTAERKRWFSAASFSHPAKMHLSLQFYLIEHYTKKGDTILDPMTGSGTILVACALERNVICVELEKKFCDMQKDNWDKIKSLGPMLGYKMGEAVIFQGDARNLDNLLVDKCIFSPPYAEAQTGGGIAKKGYINNKSHSKNPDTIGNRSYMPENAGQSNGQIGNLPYGEISAVISSPPYAEGLAGDGKGIDLTKTKRDGDIRHQSLGHLTKKVGFGGNPNNIGNLPYKADAVITSPPYSEIFSKGHKSKLGKTVRQGSSYFDDDLDPSIKRLRKHGRTDDKAGGPYGRSLGHPYSGAAENIGNLKSENYLEAMLQVYRQCHRVLKEKGLMVLVVKNFIREKKIVQLDLDTIKLCEQAGFVLIERLKRKLTQMSFWRRIYQQKYPDAPTIDFEDVLVFERTI